MTDEKLTHTVCWYCRHRSSSLRTLCSTGEKSSHVSKRMKMPFRATLFTSLIIAIALETFDVLYLNVETFNPRVARQAQSALVVPAANEWSPRVVLLGSDGEDFAAKLKRPLRDDMWYGGKVVNYTNDVSDVGILRNPVTLKNKGGEGECVPAAEWQTQFHPTCNSFHEVEFHFRSETQKPLDSSFIKLFGIGTSRDAWKLSKYDEMVILKTIQMSRDFSPLTFHFQIIDAIASEQLSSSEFVTDIYGFCGLSVFNEPGRPLELNDDLTKADRLRLARDLAGGLADAHDTGGASHSMMAHADLRHSNVLLSYDTGVLKLSDFNQAYFLGKSKKTNEMCGYRPRFSFWHDRFAAPEECLRDVQTEKTDIYHLGGMIFYFYTGYKPYTFNLEDFHRKEKSMKNGNWALPALPPRLENPVHPANVALRKAINATFHFNSTKRASAREIFKMLNSTYDYVKDLDW